MSIITWRWYQIGPKGALLPFNDTQPHVPNEPVKAGCLNHGTTGGHLEHYEHVASGRKVMGGPSFSPPISEQSFRNMIERGEIIKKVDTSHEAPVMECSCGHYVFKWSEDALALPRVGGYAKLCKVFACVEVWGRMIEHDIGYRAEWSQLRGIHSFGRKVNAVYEVDRARTVEELIERWEPSEDTDDPALPDEIKHDLRKKIDPFAAAVAEREKREREAKESGLFIPKDWRFE